jgi:hypothetical protein
MATKKKGRWSALRYRYRVLRVRGTGGAAIGSRRELEQQVFLLASAASGNFKFFPKKTPQFSQ